MIILGLLESQTTNSWKRVVKEVGKRVWSVFFIIRDKSEHLKKKNR